MGGGGSLEIFRKIKELEHKLNDMNNETSVPVIRISTSILDYARESPNKRAVFVAMSGLSYTGNDLPSENYKYGTGIIIKRSETSINIILFPENAGLKSIRNTFISGNWSGWKNLDGETI